MKRKEFVKKKQTKSSRPRRSTVKRTKSLLNRAKPTERLNLTKCFKLSKAKRTKWFREEKT